MSDKENNKLKKIGDTIVPEWVPEVPITGRLRSMSKLAFTASGTIENATETAQKVYAVVVPERGDLRQHSKTFLKQSKKLADYDIDLIIHSETTHCSQFGLEVGQLTEEEAVIALESLLRSRAGKRGIWKGVALGAIPVALLWALEKFAG